jgi:hypothetical protein
MPRLGRKLKLRTATLRNCGRQLLALLGHVASEIGRALLLLISSVRLSVAGCRISKAGGIDARIRF